MRRLNWRQLVIHFIATWFFMYSFKTLSFLADPTLVDIIRQSKNSIDALSKSGTTPSDLTTLVLWIEISPIIGLLVAFIISLTISIKRHWFWANSVCVLITAYVLNWLGLLGWNYLKNIFLTPGEIFRNTSLEFLSNGLILLALGLLTFFLRKSNGFIRGNNVATA